MCRLGISGLSNLVVIIFLLFFNDKLGIYGLSYCMVFAWLVQLLVQIPFAKKFGYKFKFFIDFKDPNLKRVFILVDAMDMGFFHPKGKKASDSINLIQPYKKYERVKGKLILNERGVYESGNYGRCQNEVVLERLCDEK